MNQFYKDILVKYGWKEISVAVANKSDDIWVYNGYLFVHGLGGSTFYIEYPYLVEGVKMITSQPKQSHHYFGFLDDVLQHIQFEFWGDLTLSRNNKIDQLLNG